MSLPRAAKLVVRELTPVGRGAISVLSVRGSAALAAVAELAGPLDARERAPRLVRLRVQGEDLDEALVCVLGADEVELHVHGSPVLVRRIRAHFARAQTGGDAHMDARATTLEEHAWEALAGVASERGARILLDQARGALRRELAPLPTRSPDARNSALAALLERGRIARFALAPVQVVLAGPTNAGKSTLFNVLCGAERALVSAEPGTTRDVVRQAAQFGHYPVELVDTAGERELAHASASDAIEAHGQARARAAVQAAELTLWLEPLDAAPQAPGEPEFRSPREPEPRATREYGPSAPARVLVRTCADRAPAAAARGAHTVSALREPAAARRCVLDLFRAHFRLPPDPWTPDAGVPFTPELLARIASLSRARDAHEHARALAAVLEDD